MAFSGDGLRLASGSKDGTVRVWDAETGQEKLTLNRAPSASDVPFSIAVSDDGPRILAGGDATVSVWEAERPSGGGRRAGDAP